MKNKLRVLQSWRFFAFLTIFLWHASKIFNININLAGFGVEFFFVLSGFVMAYNYWDKEEKKKSLKETFLYVLKKIKKFYPLFILALIIKLPVTVYKYYLEVGAINFEFFKISIVRLIPSLFLIQSWIPSEKFYYAYNGVAWFLDILVFCYFLTPCILNKISKKNEKSLLLYFICITIIKEVYLCFFAKNIGNDARWADYICPLYRFLDYLLGILIGGIFIFESKKNTNLNFSIFEFVIIGLLIITRITYVIKIPFIQDMMAIGTVFVFAFEKGWVSRLINKDWLVHLGDLSMELFLLHQPIIRYFEFVSNKFNSLYIRIILFVLLCITVFVFSELCSRYLKKWMILKNDKNSK